MSRIINRFSSTLLFFLTITFLTSCVGHAINNFNDHCPITLYEGITITKAESIKTGPRTDVMVTVQINNIMYDLPASNDMTGWRDIYDTLYEMARGNSDYNELVNTIRDYDGNTQFWFRIVDGNGTERGTNRNVLRI